MLTLLGFTLAAALNLAHAADVPLNVEVKGKTLTATVPEGFHFNQKAPNVVTVASKRVNPTFPDAHKVQFSLPSEDVKDGFADFYVCDDAMTFCKAVHYGLNSNAKVSGAADKIPAQKIDTGVGIDRHEFILDNMEYAQAQAKKGHKLILADVAARWCPGCVRLETETFGTKQFAASAKNFVKLHLDFDRFENSFWKEKYAIHGIPTLLVLTADGQEISRILDYQSPETIASFLKAASAEPTPIAQLKQKADAGNKAAIKALGQRLYAAERFEESIPYLKKSKAIELADAKVQAAAQKYKTDPKTKDAYIAALEAAIKGESKSSRSVLWRTALLELLDAKDPRHDQVYKEGLAVSDDLLARPAKIKSAMAGEPAGEFQGLEKLLIASDRADLVEAANPGEADVLKAKEKVAEIGHSLKIPVKRAGPSLRYLIFMTSAHQYADAEKLAKDLLKQDPGNPELQRRLVRILNEQKKFAEAVPVGQLALPKSYGQNEVWVAGQLAKAYIGAGDKKSAKELLTSYLSRGEMDMMKKDKKDFEEMLKTL